MTKQVGRDGFGVFIHVTAEVSERATIGTGTRIWHQAQVREDAAIGIDCILGKGVYVDVGVQIGNRCKLENGVCVFRGFNLQDGVFVGPGTILLNDLVPRAINPDGARKMDDDWRASKGSIHFGASVGGGAVLLPGVTVGRFAMVGAGAVVTRDVVDHGLVFGNPARLYGFVCACGRRLDADSSTCLTCGRTLDISSAARSQVVRS